MKSLPSLLVALLATAFLVLPAAAQSVVPPSIGALKLSFAPVVKKVAPTVVNIYTRRVVQTTSPLLNDPLFRQFFGQMGIPRERVERSLGSGVIVRPDGIVVTNNHVIEGADQITVVLSDRREFEAKVLGTDQRTDLAVLRIDTKGEKLPVMALGDSDALEVGDVVLAIGDPFGVGQTVTMGIVSALARTGVGISDYRFFIQTDAAINPGNSGGALVGMDGKLAGINSEIYSQSGGSVGIGFAIPANMVSAVVASITAGGKSQRPWLGASGQSVTADMYEQFKLPHPEGVLINGVAPGGPAALAGIQVGDVITEVNGLGVDDPEALDFRVATLSAGTTIPIVLVRAGVAQTVSLRLAAPPEIPPRDTTLIDGQNPLGGATIANVNPALAEEIGLSDTDKGVVVVSIAPGSLAERVGFQAGDFLLSINGQPVKAAAEATALLHQQVPRWQISRRRGTQVLNMSIGG